MDQSTGLERFEILGKMQGIDVFDMKPLDASRKGISFTIFQKQDVDIVFERKEHMVHARLEYPGILL